MCTCLCFVWCVFVFLVLHDVFHWCCVVLFCCVSFCDLHLFIVVCSFVRFFCLFVCLLELFCIVCMTLFFERMYSLHFLLMVVNVSWVFDISLATFPNVSSEPRDSSPDAHPPYGILCSSRRNGERVGAGEANASHHTIYVWICSIHCFIMWFAWCSYSCPFALCPTYFVYGLSCPVTFAPSRNMLFNMLHILLHLVLRVLILYFSLALLTSSEFFSYIFPYISCNRFGPFLVVVAHVLSVSSSERGCLGHMM